MPDLQLYNSLSRKKEVFAPCDPAHVRLYACGPTVYNYAHIGNARMAVVFDLLARLLRTLYPRVIYVSNITDIDDKIIAAARESGEDINALTRRYEEIYNADMAALGVAPPDVQPRATGHIGEMIALIESLLEKGHAYAAEGHVLFSVPSFPKYGGLSGRSRDDQIAGARVEIAPYKKDPADFVLWKPSKADEPGWESPWGRGRPGWHIECSAMAEKHLGLPFDIHGGGADLKFPHHENEIAQSCCAHGAEDDLAAFARVWVHNGFVTVEGEKMSKSLGNVTLVHDLLRQGFRGEVLRFALLTGHYRQPLDWSGSLVERTKKTLDNLYRVLFDFQNIEANPADAQETKVFLELCDDLNTAKAHFAIGFAASQLRGAKTSKEQRKHKAELLAGAKLLGILQQDPSLWLGYSKEKDGQEIEKLLQQREEARLQTNFTLADEIRAELDAMGIIIEDTPQGPKWRRGG